MTVSAKTKSPKVGQATTNLLKSLSEGKILSHSHALKCWFEITSNVILFQIKCV